MSDDVLSEVVRAHKGCTAMQAGMDTACRHLVPLRLPNSVPTKERMGAGILGGRLGVIVVGLYAVNRHQTGKRRDIDPERK
ncbi:hypothetical protein L226DRAFT_534516 [Lentinus tigrinus ALCF2SS1-7]|uniref:uncharacterized protein n=1 Tax=Lentinus tigrinus ALCF2SS1-7 TaxID=1328758 RepID=UPI001165E553|nr:hypothetical protein L226DRAFT_534516 [Lentinus tigrinus ALCF2SS1-7]